MLEQIRMIPGEHPDDVIRRAHAAHHPIATWALFSGGNDSTVLAHRCRDQYEGLAWIDTGTAVPGVVEFVEEFAAWVGKPLRILSAGDAYKTMVLGSDRWWERFNEARDSDPDLTIESMIDRDEAAYGQGSGVVRGTDLDLGQIPHGFPGAGAHGRAFSRLKERGMEAHVARCKVGHPRSSRVLLLSGIRRAESQRRAKRESITRRGGTVFANPLIDWSNAVMREYRREHSIPESPAAALLHRSGECNCGAFANAEDERPQMTSLFPSWWAEKIAPLEVEAERRGIRWCRWGGYDVYGNAATDVSDEPVGLLCQDCPSRLFHPDELSPASTAHESTA